MLGVDEKEVVAGVGQDLHDKRVGSDSESGANSGLAGGELRLYGILTHQWSFLCEWIWGWAQGTAAVIYARLFAYYTTNCVKERNVDTLTS